MNLIDRAMEADRDKVFYFQLNKMTESVISLKSQMESLTAAIEGLSGLVDTLNERVDALNERITK